MSPSLASDGALHDVQAIHCQRVDIGRGEQLMPELIALGEGARPGQVAPDVGIMRGRRCRVAGERAQSDDHGGQRRVAGLPASFGHLGGVSMRHDQLGEKRARSRIQTLPAAE